MQPPMQPPSKTPEDHLFDRRIVFVRGALDQAAAGHAAAQLMTLDATGDDAVTLYLDATGPSIDAAFALMDVIDLLGVPVHAVAMGRVEGAAVGVLAVAPRRSISPNARVYLRDPDVETPHGNAAQLAAAAQAHTDQLQRFHQRLAAATKRPLEHVEADCGTGRFLDAEQAVAYGLADEVSLTRRPT